MNFQISVKQFLINRIDELKCIIEEKERKKNEYIRSYQEKKREGFNPTYLDYDYLFNAQIERETLAINEYILENIDK